MDPKSFLLLVIVASVLLAALSQFKKLIGLNWGIWLVCLLFGLIPFQVFLPVTSEITGATLTALTLFGVGILRWLLEGYLFEDETAGIVAILICTMVASALVAPHRRPGLVSLTSQLWMLTCFFALAQNLYRQSHHRYAVLAMLGGSVIVSAFGLGTMATHGRLLHWVGKLGLTHALYCAPEPPIIGSSQLYGYNRLYDPAEVNFGTFVNVDYFGSFLTAPVLVSLALVLSHRHSRHRFAYAIVFVVTSISLLMTQGRGAILAALVGAGVMSLRLIWEEGNRSWFWWAAIALALGVLATVAWLLSSSTFLSWVDRTLSLPPKFTLQHIRRSGDLRRHLWLEAMGIALQRPWLGWGSDSTTLQVQLTYGQAHSWYIETFIESGIVGLAARLALILVAIEKCFLGSSIRDRSTHNGFMRATSLGLGCFLVAFLVDGVANDPTRTVKNTMLFWSLMGLVASSGRCHLPRKSTVNLEVARMLRPAALVMAVLVIGGMVLSLSIVYLEENLYILSVILGVVMLGFSAMSIASWARAHSEQRHAPLKSSLVSGHASIVARPSNPGGNEINHSRLGTDHTRGPNASAFRCD